VVIAAIGFVAEACGSKTDLLIGIDSRPAMSGAGGAEVTPPGGSAGGSGSAGAGAAGASDACDPAQLPLTQSLLHRYSFAGTGTVITDSVAGALGDGTLVASDGSALDGAGVLRLVGSNGYVDLPDALISKLTEVTLMAWVSWPGGYAYQRIFDFGNTTLGADPMWPGSTYSGTSYLAASPYTAFKPGGNVGVELKTKSTPTTNYGAVVTMKDGVLHQVTVVFRDHEGVQLYVDAQLAGALATPNATLSEIEDVNDWLGRSQTSKDTAYKGTFSEFRIYAEALGACAIANELAAGPDSAPLRSP
jgi:hypothetical protein